MAVKSNLIGTTSPTFEVGSTSAFKIIIDTTAATSDVTLSVNALGELEFEGQQVAVGNQTLPADPGADSVLFWNDTSNQTEWTQELSDSFLSANVPLLNANNIFTHSFVTSAAITLQSALPAFDLTETGVTADNGRWRWFVNGEGMSWQAINDADTVSSTFLDVQRTGTNVDSIALAADAITLNGVNVTDYARLSQNNTFTGGTTRLQADRPILEFYHTAAGTNEKYWSVEGDDFGSNNGSFAIYTRSDAGSFGEVAVEIERSGIEVTAIKLTADAITLNGVNVTDYARLSQANTFSASQTVSVAAGAKVILGSSAGNALIQTTTSGQQDWVCGVDRADSGAWKISNASDFSSTRFAITPAGNFDFKSGTVKFNGAITIDTFGYFISGSNGFRFNNSEDDANLLIISEAGDFDFKSGAATFGGALTVNNNITSINNNVAIALRDSGGSASDMTAYVSLRDSANTERGWMGYGSGNTTLNIQNSIGAVTINGGTAWHSGNDGSGSGLDADTVDGAQLSALVQTTGSQSIAGVKTFTDAMVIDNNTSPMLHLSATNSTPWAIRLSRDDLGDNSGVFFHNSPYIGWYFEDNIIIAGNTNWHSGNDGAGSGLDADTLDGLQPAEAASGSTIVQRHASGYIFATYFNQSSGDSENPTISQFMVQNGSDGYNRKASVAHVRSTLGTVADSASTLLLRNSNGWVDARVIQNTASTADGMYIGYGMPSSAYTTRIYSQGSTSSNVTIDASGNLTASGNVTAFSDRRMKRNLKRITNALDKVGKLTGYTYTRIDLPDKKKRHAGLIAQEVEKILPEVVDESLANESPYDKRKGKRVKTLNYDGLHGLIVEAIKELRDELRELKEML